MTGSGEEGGGNGESGQRGEEECGSQNSEWEDGHVSNGSMALGIGQIEEDEKDGGGHG